MCSYSVRGLTWGQTTPRPQHGLESMAPVVGGAHQVAVDRGLGPGSGWVTLGDILFLSEPKLPHFKPGRLDQHSDSQP